MKGKGNLIIIISLLVLICAACVSAPPPGPVRSGFIKRYDKNRDGRISRREYPGPVREFNRLDRNRDNFIDVTEAP